VVIPPCPTAGQDGATSSVVGVEIAKARVGHPPKARVGHPPGQITNPTIDLKSLSNTEKQIVASDGSKLNLPDILVTDHSDGSRQIVFHPEEGDFEQLSGKNYRIHSVGSDCSSLDDCQPFIVWAK